mmetsp:Transcript_79575/g.200146  ORF Transcript_79575/g.200146 Transcript_79575/m.200146 type:complete len:254 (-) Transcript_79575:168-929(-)
MGSRHAASSEALRHQPLAEGIHVERLPEAGLAAYKECLTNASAAQQVSTDLSQGRILIDALVQLIVHILVDLGADHHCLDLEFEQVLVDEHLCLGEACGRHQDDGIEVPQAHFLDVDFTRKRGRTGSGQVPKVHNHKAICGRLHLQRPTSWRHGRLDCPCRRCFRIVGAQTAQSIDQRGLACASQASYGDIDLPGCSEPHRLWIELLCMRCRCIALSLSPDLSLGTCFLSETARVINVRRGVPSPPRAHVGRR